MFPANPYHATVPENLKIDFSHILQWRLLEGSHEFPGPDGGTCLNEAAIVAAGFKYRAVKSAEDCPPCFSRVIATYAIRLNDLMPDDLRQDLLLPFVVRLAGTADNDAKEIERAQYIVVQTVERILPLALRVADARHKAAAAEAQQAADAALFAAAVVADSNAADAGRYANAAVLYAVIVSPDGFPPDAADDAGRRAAVVIAAANALKAAANAASIVARYDAHAARYDAALARFWAGHPEGRAAAAADAARSAADLARTADAAGALIKEIFTIATAIFDEAIRLGRQAEPIETDLVVNRMEAVMQSAREAAGTTLDHDPIKLNRITV
jgi:hypothetical protein